MKPVMLTKAQTDAVLSVCREVLAGSPEEWAAATGRTVAQANREWAILDRAVATLDRSYPEATQ